MHTHTLYHHILQCVLCEILADDRDTPSLIYDKFKDKFIECRGATDFYIGSTAPILKIIYIR